MKKLLTIVMMLLPMLAGAQELANFVIMSDDSYQTEDVKDFVVIPFGDKAAHQIYQELATNVGFSLPLFKTQLKIGNAF